MLYSDPCVFVVGSEYQIAFNTTEFGIAWVEVGDRVYRDSENGLMRSETLIHKVALPMHVLDEARSYTVCFRALPERRPYFPELGPEQRATYAFRPVDFSDGLQIYMLADTHSMVEEPVRAAAHFGDKLDLLILNGDIPAESKRIEDIRAIYDVTSGITHGNLPVVFARGNHDYRGKLATELTDYIGTWERNTYFTFRIGSLWGIALDCGEDKMDDSIEYGGLVDCHDMRLKETDFLRSVIDNAQREYLAPGVEMRIALCHIPFCTRSMESSEPKFNIECPLYAEWTALLNQMQLDVMLSGHTHVLETVLPGSDRARMDMNYPVIIGSQPMPHGEKSRVALHDGARYVGTAFEFVGGEIRVLSTDDLERVSPLATLKTHSSY